MVLARTLYFKSVTMEEEEEEEDDMNEGGIANAKTPVSLLQELYVRRGITPKYDLVQIEGAVHEPTFKYRVTVGEFVATGCGQSKKKAKHSAAKHILDKLLGAQNAGKAPPGQPVIPDLAQDVFSPYDDGIQGNPVGILQELCMSRRWPPPTYDLSHEEGLPHERSFNMVCIIGAHRETGAGKSKKLAKRQAANKMIAKLQLIPTETDENAANIDDDDLAQGIVIRLSQFKENSLKMGGNQSQVSKFHRILKNADGRLIKKLHNLDISDDSDDIETRELSAVEQVDKVVELTEGEDDNAEEEVNLDTDPVLFLERIGKEQRFDVTFVEIEEVSKSGQYQCLVQLSTLPAFASVCFGSGATVETAKLSAAENAIDYLRVMTRK